jgi:hypothetical protein
MLMVLVFFAVMAIWFIICNERTYRDKMRMLGAVKHGISSGESSYDQSVRKMDMIKSVPYERHFLHRVGFRNPNNLYPDEVRVK